MSSPEPVRPGPAEAFAPLADPRLYVERPATREALDALLRSVERGAGVTALRGPDGIGKTLLLRVLEERLASRARPVVLPYPSLPADALARWALELLAEPAESEPEHALLAAAQRLAEAGTPLVLLLDEASALPLPSARRLAALSDEAGPALRLLFVLGEDERAERIRAAVGPEVTEVRLEAPLTRSELERYVHERLRRGDVPPALQRRFDAPTLDFLHRASEGLPGALHALATEVLRGPWAGPPPAERAEAAGEEAVEPGTNAGAAERASRPQTAGATEARRAAKETDRAGAARAAGPARTGTTATPGEAAGATSTAESGPAAERPVAEPGGSGGAREAAEPTEAAKAGTPGLAAGLMKAAKPRKPAEPSEPAASSPAAEPAGPEGPRAAPEGRGAGLPPGAPGSPERPRVRLGGRRGRDRRRAAGARRRAVPLVVAGLAAALVAVLALPGLRARLPVPAFEGSEGVESLLPGEAGGEQGEQGAEGSRRPPAAEGPRDRPEAEAARPAPSAERSPPAREPLPGVSSAPPPAEGEPAAGTDTGTAGEGTPGPEAGAGAGSAEVAPPSGPPRSEAAGGGAAAAPPVSAPAPGAPGSAAEPEAAPAAPAPEPVPVHINATPWARIEVDGEAIGVTPLAGVPLAPGEHLFRARFPGGRVVERRVDVSETRRHVAFPAPAADTESAAETGTETETETEGRALR